MNSKANKMKNVFCYILCFMYIFNFNINQSKIFTSVNIVAIFCFFALFFKKGFIEKYVSVLRSKFHFCLFTIFLLIIFISFLSPIIQSTNDFSFLKTILHQFYSIEVGLLLYSYMIIQMNNIQIVNIIIFCFLVQAIVQFLCFVFPPFKTLTDIFRDEYTIYKSSTSYIGFRGLAISGNAFFGLAAAYAIVFYLIIMKWEDILKINIVGKIACVFLLLFGGLSAGRTSIVGIIIGFGFTFLKRFMSTFTSKKITIKFTNIITLLLIVLVAFTALKYFNNSTNISVRRMRNYITEFTNGILSGDGLSSSGTGNRLFNEMYFSISDKQLLIGDGQYMVGNSYYMKTDAGYMRPILFFGIFGFSVLVILQIYMLKAIYSKDKYLVTGLIVLLFALQVKGEVIGFLIITQSMLLLLNLGYINDKRGVIDE